LAKQTIMRLIPAPDHKSDMTSVVHIKLKNGQELSKRSTAFLGTPERPLDQSALREKFLLLCLGDASSALKPKQLEQRKKLNDWFDRIQHLEQQSNLNWIKT